MIYSSPCLAKEKEDQAKFAAQPLVEKLLPVLDNFERALAAAGAENEETESLLKGIQMVYDQLQQALEQEGVTVIPTVGETFDPHIHEAVMQIQEEGYDSGVVVEELQKGYLLNERVVRPAMVKVNA
jgi:molecular chaperone GrpE